LTIVGIPALLILALLALLAFTGIYTKYTLAKLLMNKVLNIKTDNSVVLVSIGFVLMWIVTETIALIPIAGLLINSLISFILNSWGIGAIVYNKYLGYKK
jgi:hypothetical protein